MPSKRSNEASKRKRRQRNKIILFLVEGKSEINALETALSATCDAIDPTIIPYFLLMHDKDRRSGEINVGGDITSKMGVDVTNIERLVDELFFTPFFKKNSFCFPRDVSHVVQIADTDGAFIPEECVVESQTAEHVMYKVDTIETCRPSQIIERNARKRANLAKLAGLTKIRVQGKPRPYSVYFFSSNLDHYLYGDANLAPQMKTHKADEFSRECDMRPSLFYETLQGDTSCFDCSYEDSWELIQNGTNSLQPHSNLGLLIRELETEYMH